MVRISSALLVFARLLRRSSIVLACGANCVRPLCARVCRTNPSPTQPLSTRTDKVLSR